MPDATDGLPGVFHARGPLQQPLMTLLVADVDPAVGQALSRLCQALDIGLLCCPDGAAALYQAGRHQPDLVLLCVDLPVVSAPDVITVLRAQDDEAPRVVLGIGDGQADRAIAGIAAGAAQVITKPYRPADLRALLDAQLTQAKARRDEQAILTVGDLELHSSAYTVHRDGHRLDLTLREFELLRLLMLHAPSVVSSDQIWLDLWGGGPRTGGNTIATHIRRLRAHLTGSSAEIVSVRGVGYRISALETARELS